MTQASVLTRQGDLQAATAAIQRALGMRSGAAEADLSPSQESTVAPATSSGLVLDGLTRWADTAPAPESDAATAAEPQTQGARDAWTSGQFEHQGRAMAYRLFVPARAGEITAPMPLVVMLHGCTQDANDFATGTRMNDLAREQGFVVLYPEQAQRGNAQKCWNWFKAQHQARGRGEPAAIAALTRYVVEAHPVDASRIYVAGLSAGGAMADILGRAYPDLFAGIGVHSGLAAGAAGDLPAALAAMRNGAEGRSTSKLEAPPTIVFHGDADTTVHRANGAAVVRASLQSQAGVPTPPVVTQGVSAGGQRYTRTCHGPAGRPASVEHWELHGGGHAWAGGSALGSYTHANGVDASAEMMRFFLSHRLDASIAHEQ